MSKVALVTGSSRGIGAATAIKLAQQGYSVCVNYLTRKEQADSIVSLIESSGGNAIAVQADVSIEGDVERLFNTIDHSFGAISHLVNNAGVLMPQASILEMNAERVNALFSKNVTSYFLCSREAIKRMQPGSAIVNVSSVAARTGSPFEYIDYAATKGAIDTLTKGLAIEVADKKIRVNAVRPGFIETDMHADGGEPDRINRLKHQIPLQRGGTPEEVANTIAWLLSDEASFVTGTLVDVAGGK